MATIPHYEINDRSQFEKDKSLKPSIFEYFSILLCLASIYIYLGLN